MKKTTIQSFFGRCGAAAAALSLTAGSLAGAPAGIPPAEAASPISPDGRLAYHVIWHKPDEKWRKKIHAKLKEAREYDIRKKTSEVAGYVWEYFNYYEDRNITSHESRDRRINEHKQRMLKFWWDRHNDKLNGHYDWEGTANNRAMFKHNELRDYVFARALSPENRTNPHSLVNNYLYLKREWKHGVNLDADMDIKNPPTVIRNDIKSLNALNRNHTIARFGGTFSDAEVDRRRKEIDECIAAARKFRVEHTERQAKELTEIMTDYANLVEFGTISDLKENDAKIQRGGQFHELAEARKRRLANEIPNIVQNAGLGKPGGSFGKVVDHVNNTYGRAAADYLRRSPKAKNLKSSWHLMQWWDLGPQRLKAIKYLQTSKTDAVPGGFVCKDHKTRRPALPQ